MANTTALIHEALGSETPGEKRAQQEKELAEKQAERRTEIGLRMAQQNDSRTDRSYIGSSHEIAALRAPLMDQAHNLGQLQDMLNQNSPTADALVAPQLLKTLVGGKGSGGTYYSG